MGAVRNEDPVAASDVSGIVEREAPETPEVLLSPPDASMIPGLEDYLENCELRFESD